MKTKIFDNPKTVAVTVDQQTYEKLKEVAAKEQISLSALIRRMINKALEEKCGL